MAKKKPPMFSSWEMFASLLILFLIMVISALLSYFQRTDNYAIYYFVTFFTSLILFIIIAVNDHYFKLKTDKKSPNDQSDRSVELDISKAVEKYDQIIICLKRSG